MLYNRGRSIRSSKRTVEFDKPAQPNRTRQRTTTGCQTPRESDEQEQSNSSQENACLSHNASSPGAYLSREWWPASSPDTLDPDNVPPAYPTAGERGVCAPLRVIPDIPLSSAFIQLLRL